MDTPSLVFDIETKHSFDEVGGRDRFDKLGVSVIGAYLYGEDRYAAFEEHEIPQFETLLKNAGRVIGFNIHHFDLPVLQPYISWSLREIPTLDLMEDVERGAGFRISLDNLCEMTLGAKKSADGMQALRWYKEGKIDEIKKYCICDVELTKNLYEFGKERGHVLFFSKSARGRVAIPVSWGSKLTDAIRSTIRQGLEQRQSVEIEYVTKAASYENDSPVNTRLVEVHKIFNDSFEGFCHLRQANRIFKMDQVITARLTSHSYHIIDDVQGSLL